MNTEKLAGGMARPRPYPSAPTVMGQWGEDDDEDFGKGYDLTVRRV